MTGEKPEFRGISRVGPASGGLHLDCDGALFGDLTLAELARLGFGVRRYGSNAAIDDELCVGRVPHRSLLIAVAVNQPVYIKALLKLGAPDHAPQTDPPAAAFQSPARDAARDVIARLKNVGFMPRLDAKGALFIVDTTGRRRDVTRYVAIADAFETLVDGLRAEPELIQTFTAQSEEKDT